MTHQPEPDGLLAELPDAVVLISVEGDVQWANRAAEAFSGFRLDDWVGHSVFDLLHPDDHANVINAVSSVQGQSDGLGGLIDLRVRDALGRWRPCELRGRYLDDGHLLIVFRDTADRQALELGRGDHERLRALVHHAHAVLVSLDQDGDVRSANAELARTLGHDSVDIIDRPFADLLMPDDRPAFREILHAGDTGGRIEARAMHLDGTLVHLAIDVTDLRDDPAQEGFAICAIDITDLKTTQRALRHMADHDALTGLLNRRALLSQLDTFVGDGFQHEIVILFCDLDGFKAVNDRIGHAAGDQVLVEVARRLERSVGPGDLIGRLGGDEFVVVLPRSSRTAAESVADTIRGALTEPIVAADEVVEVAVSIGVASTGDSPTAARLLATADDAMYAVKRSRKGSMR